MSSGRTNKPTSVLDCYPVGAIYMSLVETSPASLFGGTWTPINDRFLLSSGSKYGAGNTGGSDSITLTIDNMPAHSHEVDGQANLYYTLGSESIWNLSGVATGYKSATSTNGGGKPFVNMPPYLVVYMWYRIA